MVYTKTYIFNHFYQQYLVLLTMAPRNSCHVCCTRPRSWGVHDIRNTAICLVVIISLYRPGLGSICSSMKYCDDDIIRRLLARPFGLGCRIPGIRTYYCTISCLYSCCRRSSFSFHVSSPLLVAIANVTTTQWHGCFRCFPSFGMNVSGRRRS